MLSRQPRSPASSVSAPAAAMRARLLLDDGVGDVGVLDAERAAEAATDVRVRKFGERQAVDRLEQTARLVADAELAQARARVVIGDRAGEGGIDLGHAAHVDQKADQLVDLGLERLGARLPGRLVGEEAGVVQLEHAAARARRRHHVVVGLERFDHLPGDGAGVGPVAGVVGGLAAAGLRRRHLDGASARLDQLDRREADARPEQVDQAGHEQADPGHRHSFSGCGHATSTFRITGKGRNGPEITASADPNQARCRGGLAAAGEGDYHRRRTIHR